MDYQDKETDLIKKSIASPLWWLFPIQILGCGKTERSPVEQLQEARFVSSDSIVFTRSKYTYVNESVPFGGGAWFENEVQTIEVVDIGSGATGILDSTTSGEHKRFQIIGVLDQKVKYISQPDNIVWTHDLRDNRKESANLPDGRFDGVADLGESLIIDGNVIDYKSDSVIKSTEPARETFGILYESTKHAYSVYGSYEGGVELFSNGQFQDVARLDKGIYFMPWGSAILANTSRSILLRGFSYFTYVDIDQGGVPAAYAVKTNLVGGYLVSDVLVEEDMSILEDDVDLDESSSPLKVFKGDSLVLEVR